ncbi:MAG: hypothetical protein EOM24_34745, partial [Chloroflexia bacterium]|nr:hypothetical protein [Chloroflexia bacterium]
QTLIKTSLAVEKKSDKIDILLIEEPENHLHPRLLPELSEEIRTASARTQLMVTTHSPFFVNTVQPEELWVLYRNEEGYTQARRAAEMRGIPAAIAQGGKLGQLWMEGAFELGDPLTASGQPKRGNLRFDTSQQRGDDPGDRHE